MTFPPLFDGVPNSVLPPVEIKTAILPFVEGSVKLELLTAKEKVPYVLPAPEIFQLREAGFPAVSLIVIPFWDNMALPTTWRAAEVAVAVPVLLIITCPALTVKVDPPTEKFPEGTERLLNVALLAVTVLAVTPPAMLALPVTVKFPCTV